MGLDIPVHLRSIERKVTGFPVAEDFVKEHHTIFFMVLEIHGIKVCSGNNLPRKILACHILSYYICFITKLLLCGGMVTIKYVKKISFTFMY